MSTSERRNQSYEVECPICAEPFVEPRQLPCNHVYCVECLERWVANDGQWPRLTCPTCREQFQLPEHGGIHDLPCPAVPDLDDDSDDLDLGSFEIVPADVWLDNQPCDEQPDTSEIQTDNTSEIQIGNVNTSTEHNVNDVVVDDVINRNVSISSIHSDGSQLDNEDAMNAPDAQHQEHEPGAYCWFFTVSLYIIIHEKCGACVVYEALLKQCYLNPEPNPKS